MKITGLHKVILVVSVVLLIGVLTLLNYRLAAATPGGVDFLTHWVGTRALFQGQSPYSDDVARRVQELVYGGRPALAGENEFLDCYFLYTELIFAPFALIADYSVARAAWMTFLELSTFAIWILSLSIVSWKPRLPTLALLLLYGMLGYESVRPIVNGNVTTATALLIVAAIWLVKTERSDETAGFLLALALGKPNQTVVPIGLLLLWAVSLKRWRLLKWFIGSGLLLTLAGMLIVPDWPLQNLANILRYTSYNPPATLSAVLGYYLSGPGYWMGNMIAVLLTLALARAWMMCIRAPFDTLLPVLCLTLVASQWLWISTGPGNFIMLALPTVFVVKKVAEGPHGVPWSASLLFMLLVGLWMLFLLTVDRANSNMQTPLMFIPLPLVLLIGLAMSERRLKPSQQSQQAT